MIINDHGLHFGKGKSLSGANDALVISVHHLNI